MFKVVEDEQPLLGPYPRHDLLGERFATCLTDADRLGNRRSNEGGVQNRGQRDKGDTIGKHVSGFGGDRQGEPGFANAAWSGEDDQSMTFRGVQEFPDGGDLALATDEGGRWSGDTARHSALIDTQHPGGLTRRQELLGRSLALSDVRGPLVHGAPAT